MTTRLNDHSSSLALAALLALFVTPASAQQGLEGGDSLLTGYAGPLYDLGGDDDDATDPNRVELEKEWAFGGSYEYMLTSKLSLEGRFTYGAGEGELDDLEDEEVEGDDEGAEEGEEGDDEAELDGEALFFSAALVYNFRPQSRFNPYLTLGGGVVRIDVAGDRSTRPAAVFGAGLLFRLTSSVLVRVDARDHLYTLDEGGGSNLRNDVSVTGGLTVSF